MVTLNDVYQTFCAGQGMLVVLGNEEEADKFLDIVKRKRNGIDGRKAGEIVANKKSTHSHLEINGDQITLS